jgi:hypothetical protein
MLAVKPLEIKTLKKCYSGGLDNFGKLPFRCDRRERFSGSAGFLFGAAKGNPPKEP